MYKSIQKPTISILILAMALFGGALGPQEGYAGFFRGALGGAIIGGIIDGGDGAAAGAIIGGIGGAVNSSHQRRRQAQQRANYEQQAEQRRLAQEQRMRLERDRARAVQRQAAVNSPEGKRVRQIQSALTLMGFDVGPANGELNKETVDAIRAYQNSYSLLATGQPSDELLAHMRKNL